MDRRTKTSVNWLLVVLICCSHGSIKISTSADSQCYSAELVFFSSKPVVSFVDNHNSDFQQVFNPSWVEPGKNGVSGLMIRSQNCTTTRDKCAQCGGSGDEASVLTFVELLNDDSDPSVSPRFQHVSRSSVVFEPHDNTDDLGTEDPRIAYDSKSGIYYMFYTCYNSGGAKPIPTITMCLATSTYPNDASSWIRYGPVGFGEGSKSGALLIRDKGPHYLYWGNTGIHLTTSYNLTHWESPGIMFINSTAWGNPHVEAGPPPLQLSTGDYVFFHNSWSIDFPKPPGYQPAWVVLNGSDPTQIIARAQTPLFSPSREPWMTGNPPYTCNVPNVAFLEAAHATRTPDEFRIYFGGADAVIGSAVVKIVKNDTLSGCL